MHAREQFSPRDNTIFEESLAEASSALCAPLDLLKRSLQGMSLEQLQEHTLAILSQSETLLKDLDQRLSLAATTSEFSATVRSFDASLERLQAALDLYRQELPLDQSRKELKRTHDKIIEICRSEYKITKNFDPTIFDQYDLEAPYAFGDRACDQLVEAILDGYSHSNFGQYLAERRTASLSSWGADYVPDAVVKLVKKRFTARDGVLDAVHVLGDLRAAKESILEQVELQEEKKLCRLVKEYPGLSSADLVAFISERKSPVKVKLLLALEANYHRVSSLAQTDEIFASMATKLATLIESSTSAGGNRRTELEQAEREHMSELRSRSIQAILKSPSTHHSTLTANRYEYGDNLGNDISRFATDDQKNLFTDTLVQTSGRDLLRVGTAFFMAEATLLARAIGERGVQALDYSLASFPRLILLSHHLKRTESEYASSIDTYLQGVKKTQGFPVWMADWQRFFQEEMRQERRVSARANTLDCAAFGRFKGNHVPMSEALSLMAGSRRRGLEFPEPL